MGTETPRRAERTASNVTCGRREPPVAAQRGRASLSFPGGGGGGGGAGCDQRDESEVRARRHLRTWVGCLDWPSSGHRRSISVQDEQRLGWAVVWWVRGFVEPAGRVRRVDTRRADQRPALHDLDDAPPGHPPRPSTSRRSIPRKRSKRRRWQLPDMPDGTKAVRSTRGFGTRSPLPADQPPRSPATLDTVAENRAVLRLVAGRRVLTIAYWASCAQLGIPESGDLSLHPQ